jgi:hypothetical protein
MRPLTEDESKAVFEKLANYIVSGSWSLRPYGRTYASGTQGEKSRPLGGQAGRGPLLSLAEGSRLLCL